MGGASTESSGSSSGSSDGESDDGDSEGKGSDKGEGKGKGSEKSERGGANNQGNNNGQGGEGNRGGNNQAGGENRGGGEGNRGGNNGGGEGNRGGANNQGNNNLQTANVQTGNTTSQVFRPTAQTTSNAPLVRITPVKQIGEGIVPSDYILSKDQLPVTVPEGSNLTHQLPKDTFSHTSRSAKMKFESRLVDGSPLPTWVKFNPARLSYSGTPPKGAGGSYEIMVIAKDQLGNQANAKFNMNLGNRQ